MLALMPIGAMNFPGTGILENLAEKAKKLRITAWRFARIAREREDQANLTCLRASNSQAECRRT